MTNPTSSERDLVISRRMQKLARRVTDLVRRELGEELGVALLVFPWSDIRGIPEGTPAEFQYISNAPRSHMHGMLKELIAKWDKGDPDTPPHLRQ